MSNNNQNNQNRKRNNNQNRPKKQHTVYLTEDSVIDYIANDIEWLMKENKVSIGEAIDGESYHLDVLLHMAVQRLQKAGK